MSPGLIFPGERNRFWEEQVAIDSKNPPSYTPCTKREVLLSNRLRRVMSVKIPKYWAKEEQEIKAPSRRDILTIAPGGSIFLHLDYVAPRANMITGNLPGGCELTHENYLLIAFAMKAESHQSRSAKENFYDKEIFAS